MKLKCTPAANSLNDLASNTKATSSMKMKSTPDADDVDDGVSSMNKKSSMKIKILTVPANVEDIVSSGVYNKGKKSNISLCKQTCIQIPIKKNQFGRSILTNPIFKSTISMKIPKKVIGITHVSLLKVGPLQSFIYHCKDNDRNKWREKGN